MDTVWEEVLAARASPAGGRLKGSHFPSVTRLEKVSSPCDVAVGCVCSGALIIQSLVCIPSLLRCVGKLRCEDPSEPRMNREIDGTAGLNVSQRRW